VLLPEWRSRKVGHPHLCKTAIWQRTWRVEHYQKSRTSGFAGLSAYSEAGQYVDSHSHGLDLLIGWIQAVIPLDRACKSLKTNLNQPWITLIPKRLGEFGYVGLIDCRAVLRGVGQEGECLVGCLLRLTSPVTVSGRVATLHPLDQGGYRGLVDNV
jgi:hypothetical protein